MHTRALTHAPTFIKRSHENLSQTPFSAKDNDKTAILFSKRLSDDEREMLFFFSPYDFLFYFDVWNGCDQRGLTSPLLSFFYSPQYNAVSSTPPPTVTENTHPRQAQTVPSRLLILDLRVCLAGFVFQENDAF